MITLTGTRTGRRSLYWLGVFKAAGKNWLDSQAFIHSAALAFFTVFSIAPVVILVVAGLGNL
jgi:membrane protein